MTIVEATMTGALGPMYPSGRSWMISQSKPRKERSATALRRALRLWRWKRGKGAPVRN